MKKRTNPVIEMVNSDVTTSTVSTLREVGDQTIIRRWSLSTIILGSLCATYNNQLPQLHVPPLRKQDLINAIEREFQDHSESYLVFYTKTREQFFSELYHYKTQKIQF